MAEGGDDEDEDDEDEEDSDDREEADEACPCVVVVVVKWCFMANMKIVSFFFSFSHYFDPFSLWFWSQRISLCVELSQ